MRSACYLKMSSLMHMPKYEHFKWFTTILNLISVSTKNLLINTFCIDTFSRIACNKHRIAMRHKQSVTLNSHICIWSFWHNNLNLGIVLKNLSKSKEYDIFI